VLAGFAVALCALVAFVAIEARSSAPMLPLGFFRSRTFSAASAMGLVLNVAVYGLIFVLSLYFQRAQGRTALETGLAFAPMTGIVMATNIGAGRLARRVGARRVMLLGAVLAGAGCFALLFVDAGTPYVAMVGQLVAFGAGVGLVVPLMTSELLGSVDRARSGAASGTLNTMRQTGSVIGVALYGSLSAGGLHPALGVSAGALLCTGVLAMLA
jgi:DHA2 family methylenomycin A resistance protein-like MFS transporter